MLWKEVCLPRREGGLGLKDLKYWNSALLVKVLRDIHQKEDTLWVRWIHQEFLSSVSIWERPTRKDDSALMKRILPIRDALIQAQGSVEAAFNLMDSWAARQRFNGLAAYELFRPKGHSRVWASVVWNPCLIPKHAFILRLCAKSGILTRDKLSFMKIDPT